MAIELYKNSFITLEDAQNYFDERYDHVFGEPSTEVFTPEEFDNWMEEVLTFE